MKQKTDKTSPSQKILNTAFECLSIRGYANVSIRNIADEAGVALGQMTYYYRNKETLFLAVIDMMADQYLYGIEKELESISDDKNKLTALIGFFKRMVKDNPRLLKLFIDFTAQALWIPSFREPLNGLFDRLVELIEKNLALDTNTDERHLGHSHQSKSRLVLGALLGTSIQILLGSQRDDAFESLNLAESLFS